jgi:hypothetical protein
MASSSIYFCEGLIYTFAGLHVALNGIMSDEFERI